MTQREDIASVYEARAAALAAAYAAAKVWERAAVGREVSKNGPASYAASAAMDVSGDLAASAYQAKCLAAGARAYATSRDVTPP